MAYQVLDVDGINQQSGLSVASTTFAERLESTLNQQKQHRGMELAFQVIDDQGAPIFVFLHETDRLD